MKFYIYYLELKNRFLCLLLTWVVTILVSYYYKESLLFIIISPILNHYSKAQSSFVYFIFTDVTEIFYVFLGIIFFVCNQTCVLYLFYHSVFFFAPGFFKMEYYFVRSVLKLVVFLFFFLLSFFNLVLLPISWYFFLSFQDTTVMESLTFHFESKLNEFLTFYIEFYFICLFYCHMLLVIFIFYIFIGDSKNSKKVRKLFYYLFVVISTTLTPPDVFSQLSLSVFLIFSYEIFVFIFILRDCLTKY